jgi:hypothetical protein
VPTADPIPISAQPDISRRRRFSNDLHARRRRRHHHHAIGVVTLIGNDDARCKPDTEHEGARQTCAEPPTRLPEVTIEYEEHG